MAGAGVPIHVLHRIAGPGSISTTQRFAGGGAQRVERRSPSQCRRRQDALGRLSPVEFETLINAAHAA